MLHHTLGLVVRPIDAEFVTVSTHGNKTTAEIGRNKANHNAADGIEDFRSVFCWLRPVRRFLALLKFTEQPSTGSNLAKAIVNFGSIEAVARN